MKLRQNYPPERQDWRAGWIKKANKLANDMGVNMFGGGAAA